MSLTPIFLTPKNMMRKSTFLRLAFSLIASILFAVQGFGQVTTSSISGNVTDDKGEGLPGATVVAIHVPSGTKYGTVTNVTGRYTIPAVRIGGPYKVTTSFVGYKDLSKEGIITSLGSTANVDFKMAEEGKVLEEVVVSATRSDIFSSERTGASTTINKQALQALPTIGSRSINDFTKYNPQGNGRSFGGQDSRLNNFTIDGSVFNNGFGLGSESQAGGRTNSTAISLDAIEEVQVNVAPFDVRQSGFVGAGLNAVTRSGTNEVQGSVYHSFRNNGKSFVGTEARGLPVTIGTFDEKIYGFRLGAPIIKNKLFIFVNGEFQRRTQPALSFVAQGSTNPGNPTRVTKADIDGLSSFMQSKFGYETGPYEAYDDETTSDKFLARLDYNINDKHKATVRYTFHNSQDYVLISNSASAGFGNRINANSMSFRNSGYFIQDNTRSIVAELNSTFGGKAANNFIIGYDYQNEDRAYAGAMFPTIDILQNNQTYMSVGFDPFTPSNKLNYGTFHITDNYTLFKGKHTITLGTNYENYKSNNLFFPASNGVWVFNSLADFYASANGNKDIVVNTFQYRYSALEGAAEPLQVLKVNKFDLYAQDDFQATRNFKLSYGVRASVIAFGNTALENRTISAQTYRGLDGSPYKVNTGTLPDPKILWEPRVGFNWDVNGDRTTQIRGGSGIFTGRPPYVFISNQIGNNGILTGFIEQRNTRAFPFVQDPTVYRPATPTLPTTFDIAATDANYRFPQVWKTNIAIDQKLPFGLVGSVEFLYNKFLNSVLYFDANLEPAVANFTGPDTRARFPGSGLTGANLTNALRINDNVSRAAMLTSKTAGENISLTFKLEKPWTKGFYGMLAYTYARTRDLMSAGSIASGSWTGARSVNGNNNLGLSYSDFDIPHRVVGALSYRLDYGGQFGGSSQVSIGYVGGIGTGRYTYAIAGDMNGDGVAGNDLLFVPNRASDLTFVNTTVAGVTYTPAQQAEAFDRFIDQDPYLSKMRGRYTERNGAMLPWLNQYDLSFIQEFYVKVGGKRNTIQVRADIQNFANLLNSDWGVGQFVSNTTPLVFASVSATGVPQYRFNTQTTRTLNSDGKTTTSTTSLLKDSFQNRSGAGDVWNAQLTLRYIFN
ncbi:MAG: carboxypeptidase regulatory-like domain-containing protein [Spirosomaceae bacterium]|nr:carboxypeptidase regulatory-like domain-containing protein [Spirosomataceae bacterium]